MRRSLSVGFVTLDLVLGATPMARAADYTFTETSMPGAVWTLPAAINDEGAIVGAIMDASGAFHGFYLSEVGGTFTQIDVPGATRTQAFGITDTGAIVGTFFDASGRPHGFWLSGVGGAFTQIDVPGATTSTQVLGVNDAGVMVGLFGDGAGLHGFVLSGLGGTFTTIDVPGSTFVIAYGSNNAGKIAGTFFNTTGSHGFVKHGISGTLDIIDVPGAQTKVLGINESGTISGDFNQAGILHGFISSGGSFTTIDFPGASMTDGIRINDGGDFVGRFIDAAGGLHGFVAIAADTGAPVLSVPGDITVEATGPTGATVTYTATATDDVDGPLTPACTPPSGATFPLGATTVTCSATDSQGNSTSESFTVTVEDTTPPETLLATAIDGNGATVANGGATLSNALTLTFGGSDLIGLAALLCSVDGAPFTMCTSPLGLSALTSGPHNVTVQAVDQAANVDPSPAMFTWTVQTPLDAIRALADAVRAEPSLTRVFQEAPALLSDPNANNDVAVCGKLGAFLNKLDAKERTGKLTAEEAAELRSQAEAIEAAQGCS